MPNNSYYGKNGNQYHHQGGQQQVVSIDQIDNFWKDKNNLVPKLDLFSDFAKKVAEQINKDGEGKKNKPTQIRKFYDEILKFKKELLLDKTIFNKKLPYIKMINAKFAYSCARKNITNGCKNFFVNCINKINDYDDFMVFSDFFESFIAFYKQYDK